MNEYFEVFKTICEKLNEIGIVPTLMGSLGLSYVTNKDWNPKDIDIHVNGDPRGWNGPEENRIYDFNKITNAMNEIGYELYDAHEHEFVKDGIHVQFGAIDALYDFANILEEDIEIISFDDVKFRVPNVKQFLEIYNASSKDSYRNDKNNNKDFEKIEWLKSNN